MVVVVVVVNDLSYWSIMKCAAFEVVFIISSTFAVLSYSSLVYHVPQRAQTYCWQAHSRSEYKSLEDTKINGIRRCRAYCFDLNQLSESEEGGCNVITTYNPAFSSNVYCYLLKTAKPADAKLAYNRYDETHFMNNLCKYDSCWSEVKSGKIFLKAVAWLTEKQCRLRCIETWECMHTAFSSHTCYMQLHNDVMNSVSSQGLGTLYRVDRRCKEESCWEIHKDYDMSWSALVNKAEARDEFHCREYCLEFWQCNVYRWHYNEDDAMKRCWIMVVAVERKQSDTGSWKPGVNSWVMHKGCHDWDANGNMLHGIYGDKRGDRT